MPKADFKITPIEDIDNTVTPPETDDEYTTIHHVQKIMYMHTLWWAIWHELQQLARKQELISFRNEQRIYIKKSLFHVVEAGSR